MENITITAQTLFALLGVIATLGAATAVISRWLTPIKTLKKQVASHTEYLNHDKKAIEAIRTTDRVMCRSILALLDHAITNNSIDKLSTAKEALQQHLIDS